MTFVSDTIRKGIVEINMYEDEPGTLMIGMFSAVVGSAIWLIIASWFKLPVSTTHGIGQKYFVCDIQLPSVGGVIGFSIFSKGFQGVQWKEVGFIALTWVTSPLIAGLYSFLSFIFTRTVVLRREKSETWALRLLPLYYFVTIFVLSLSILYKGKQLHNSCINPV